MSGAAIPHIRPSTAPSLTSPSRSGDRFPAAPPLHRAPSFPGPQTEGHPTLHSPSADSSRPTSPPFHPTSQIPGLTISTSATTAGAHPVNPTDQKIYVLSADGSSLFLLDPTKPAANEEPPPYATVPGTAEQLPAGQVEDGLLDPNAAALMAGRVGSGIIGRSRSSSGLAGHRPPPQGQRYGYPALVHRAPFASPASATQSQSYGPTWLRSPGAGHNARFLPEVRIDTVPSVHATSPSAYSASASAPSQAGARAAVAEGSSSRHRASTLSSLPLSPPSSRVPMLSPPGPGSEPRSRPRYRTEHSYSTPGSLVDGRSGQSHSPARPPGSLPNRPRNPRSRSSLSSVSTHPANVPTQGFGRPRTASASYGRSLVGVGADETTPLLSAAPIPVRVGVADSCGDAEGEWDGEGEWEVLPLPSEPTPRGRGLWRSIFCGDLDMSVPADRALTASLSSPYLLSDPLVHSETEPSPAPSPDPHSDSEPDELVPYRDTYSAAFRRFWRPVFRAPYWRAVFHLAVLNFPLALLVWPFLVAGTLAGTVLLITLPLGAAVWWLTLILSRTWARVELGTQVYWHGSPSLPAERDGGRQARAEDGGSGEGDGWRGPEREGVEWRPIFYRVKMGSPVQSPGAMEAGDRGEWLGSQRGEIRWEKRFMKCSYAMFCDHSSYSALCYFLLIKPLITLPTLILFTGLFFPSLVLIVTFPVYLRAARHWGRWQASIAIDNL